MPQSKLESLLHTYFRFLLDDFGFSIVEERYGQEIGNAFVVFSGSLNRIEVVKDHGHILISLGDNILERFEWVEFAQAVQFFSKDSGPVYLLPTEDNDAADEAQVSHLARLMKLHCGAFLSGKISGTQLRDSVHEKATRDFLSRS